MRSETPSSAQRQAPWSGTASVLHRSRNQARGGTEAVSPPEPDEQEGGQNTTEEISSHEGNTIHTETVAPIPESVAPEPGAVLLPEPPANPRGVVPPTFAEAKQIMRLALLDSSTCKCILKAIKVTGAQNAKVMTKLKLIAVKMTQRRFCLDSALELVEKLESEENGDPHELQCLRPTAVKINKTADGKEEIVWLRGDVPIFENEEVLVRKPDTVNGETVQQPLQREPDFEASEYCRLLHVLADTRMTNARTQLMEPRTREKLDVEPFDPWTDQIAPLFNDLSFKPDAIVTVAGGVTRADIASLNPTIRPYERPAGVLKRKFGEFKSAYGTCLSKYESSGQGDPDGFVLFANAKTYIMYAFCFLKQNPFLEPLATRALQSDAQREEGVGDGVAPSSGDLHGYGRKRKREKQEINIVGFESISSALRPMSDVVARETEEAEGDKAKYEAAEAKGKSAQSLLSAISQAKAMMAAASSDEEKQLYGDIVKRLMDNLSGSFA